MRLQKRSYKNYKKFINNPVNKVKKQQIDILNQKSVYQNIELGEKEKDNDPKCFSNGRGCL